MGDIGPLVLGVCEFEDAGLSLLLLSLLSSEFVVASVVLSIPFFAAKAKPTKPLATISEAARAMAKRAIVFLLVNIGEVIHAMSLRDLKINNLQEIGKIRTV